MKEINNEKVLLGALGVAAIGLVIKGVKVVVDRKRAANEEEVYRFDLEDLDNEQ